VLLDDAPLGRVLKQDQVGIVDMDIDFALNGVKR